MSAFPIKMSTDPYIRAACVDDVRSQGCVPVRVGGRTLALFAAGEAIYAIDNRCPHMGFPLDRGTVNDGILTCHWHHARFDLISGGTFDLFADDVPVFPVMIRDGHVWVDVTQYGDPRDRQNQRLRDGLERNISLVIGKSVIALLDASVDPVEPFRLGLEFGVRHRASGWGPGLTVLTCMMNLLPHLSSDERPRALFHGLAHVAADTRGEAPRFSMRPLPDHDAGLPTLKRWFRQFVEVRDAEGAERCLVTAVQMGAESHELADLLYAAATDHHYIQTGHVLDFTNKAMEALDVAGWDLAEPVLSSLASSYAGASRAEESNAWRYPIDLVAVLDGAFEELHGAVAEGHGRRGDWCGGNDLAKLALGDNPTAIVDALLDALREGATSAQLGSAIAYAAALRVAQFHTSNEFGDWDTALHTFSFANAVHQGLKRAASLELLRGVFDAAMSIYLDRFLNIPPATLPEASGPAGDHDGHITELSSLLDRQQQINEAGQVVATYLGTGGLPEHLVAALSSLLLREDRDFHTIQMLEAAVRQHLVLSDTPGSPYVLVAATRYLAAHAPSARAQDQTYRTALRLHHGDRIFEGS